MLINFKPKTIKKSKSTVLKALDDVFDTAKNSSKAANLTYELLKYSKYEALFQIKMTN